ncbi:MAG: arsenosugar biosynthesis radical SAM (seleno)protein ArsS [Gammaproteobacteria bacterium]
MHSLPRLRLPKGLPGFDDSLRKHKTPLIRRRVEVLQINIGKKCDLACHHCHVEAGPKRTENMNAATIDRVIELLSDAPEVGILDITGGAPELNPHFRRLVSSARRMGKTVYDRSNLTVFYENGQEDTPEFLASEGAVIIASLPCYTPDNVEKQRGKGVFDKSIAALQKLNSLGYGKPGGLVLNLVYNPVGASLPPPQAQLQADYRRELHKHLGIEFTELYTITNMPIKRYLHYLRREKQLDAYLRLLVENFNAEVTHNVMCCNMLSVGWDGKLYDCDFNQMLDIPLNNAPATLWDISSFADIPRGIATDNHCYGCTAGAGSSCGGALSD